MANKTVSVRLQAVTAQYQAAMAKAGAATQAFGASAKKSLGTAQKDLGAMTKAGPKMRTMLADPLAALATPAGAAAFALAGAAKAAIDFESAWTGVEKTVSGTPAQLAALEQGIRDMAKELPASHGEIAAVAEAAGALGIETPNILKFTRTMIDLGETTDLSADRAATALAKLANITQMPEKNFDRLGSALVALGNNGASTEAEIAEMALRIAGAGNQIGLTEAEILGFSAALADVGIQAEMGGSAISRVMLKIAKVVSAGGDDLQKFAAIAGMTSQQFSTRFRTDAAGAVVAFAAGLGKLRKSGMSTDAVLDKLGFTELRVADTLRRLAGAGDNVAESMTTATEGFRENEALATEAEKRYATTAAQLEVFKNQVIDVAISFGQVLLPAINTILGPLSDLLGLVGKVEPLIGPLLKFGVALTFPGLYVGSKIKGFFFDKDEVEEASAALEGLRLKFGDVGASVASVFQAGASTEFQHSSRSLKLLAEAFDDTEKEATELTSAIEALIGVHLNLDEAAVQFASGLADLRKAIKDNGNTLDINTEKGRENRSAFTAAAQNALDWANAQIEAGASTEKTTQKLRAHITQLKTEAVAAGLSEDAVTDYIQRLNLTPNDIKTLIKLFDDEAKRKVDEFKRKLDGIDRNVTVSLNVVGRSVGSVFDQVANNVRHGGGVAGASGPKRYGSMLRGDEVPTILQRGEIVLSKAQAASPSLTRSGGGGQVEGTLRLIGDKGYLRGLIREELASMPAPPETIGARS